jgi:hypothetical protein
MSPSHKAQLWSRVIFLLSLVTTPATAQIVAPSTYTTAITVQGEVAGEEFADWAGSGITVIDADPADNFGDLDIANIQVANDNNFVYIHATLHNASPVVLSNLYLAFDTDRDNVTGWNILQAGEIGSELGYQTDFPFAQHELSYNLGLSLIGGPVGNGGALIYPFWTGVSNPPEGIEIEWAVPLDSVIQFPPALGGPAPAFPNTSFDFVVYTDQGLADMSQVISYTLAEPPAGESGDFDLDGDVDGIDFLIWQRGGSPAALSAEDLSDRQVHYGAGVEVASAIAVPEPGLTILLSTALLRLALGRRRTR